MDHSGASLRSVSMPMDLSGVQGGVARTVVNINAATGAAGRDYGRSGGVQHGSTEQGSTPRHGARTTRRERDRDRDDRQSPSPRADHRMQNRQDLEGIVEKIHDRLDTIERITRLHAQSIAQTDESVAQLRENTNL